MKLHEYFAGLLTDSVNINAARLEQLAEHEKALTRWLREDPQFGAIMEGFSRQGSWAHRTIIRPLPGQEFDADLLIQMERQQSWSDDPQRYLEALHETMLRSPRYRDRVELKSRCVRVRYAGDCHVDLVPFVHVPFWLYEQQFIVNRKANEFERVNPAEFAAWVRGKDRLASGHLRTSLRLLKFMRDYKGTFDVPSVILTVVVGSRVNWGSAIIDRYSDLPTAFRSLVTGTDRWLQAQSCVPVIKDPSCPAADFSHRLDEASFRKFHDRFHGYADAVRTAYKEADRQESVRLWRGVFGDAFAPAGSRTRLGVLRIMGTAAGPFPAGQPDLIVQQPLARPRQDRVPDRHRPVPFAGVVEAQFVSRVDMRQRAGAGADLQDRVADPDSWPCARLVADLDGVGAGLPGWLQRDHADQPTPVEADPRAGNGPAYQARLLRHGELTAQRESP